MAKDKIIELMARKCEKWMKIPQTKEHDAVLHKKENNNKKLKEMIIPTIGKVALDYYPLYMSFTHKEATTVEIKSSGSSLEREPKYCIDKDQGIRIEARFGNYEKCNVVYESEDAPIEEKNKKNPYKSLEELLDSKADDDVKEGLKDSGNNMGESLTTKMPFKKFSKEEPVNYFEKSKRKINERDVKKLARYVKNMASKIDAIDCVQDCEVKGYVYEELRRFVNSEGSQIKDSWLMAYISVKAEIRYGDGGESTYAKTITNTKSLSQLLNKNLIEKETKYLEKFLPKLSKAKPQPSGAHITLVNPSAFSAKFHEGFYGHQSSYELVSEQQNTTFSEDRIGEKIINQPVTIIDDPTQKGGHATYKYDEEGIPAQPVTLVKKGKLCGYQKSRSSGNSNGHSRAEDIFEPEPRQSNIEIICHNKKQSIKDLKRKMRRELKRKKEEYGLYVKGAGGEVNIGAHGDEEKEEQEEFGYEGTLKISPVEIYRIYVDGREELVSRVDVVTEANDLLTSLIATGGPYKTVTGRCVSGSGEIPIQCRCPYALFRKVSFKKISPKGTSTDQLDKDIED